MEGVIRDIVALMEANAWATKLIFLAAFIALMVTVVAWLYSGEIQNTEIGPLALRGYDTIEDGQLFGPKTIVTNNIDGKKANCSIWVNYTTRGGAQVHKRLWENRLQFGQIGRRYSFASADIIGFWNQPRVDTVRAYLTDAGLPADAPGMFADTSEPFDIRTAVKDTDYEVIALSKEDFEKLQRAHAAFLEEPIKVYSARKTAAGDNQRRLKALHNSKYYKNLPDVAQEARIYVRMRFNIDPWHALTKHPDREVKTTAWLTVLTSVFAVMMQLIYNGLG
jgi:hypothetical protein